MSAKFKAFSFPVIKSYSVVPVFRSSVIPRFPVSRVPPHLYRSTYHALTKTMAEEGVRGFYAGSASAMISNVGENAVLFVFYGHCQRLVQWAAGLEDASDMTVGHRAFSGSLASVFSSFAITPPDRIKCTQQVLRQAVGKTRA